MPSGAERDDEIGLDVGDERPMASVPSPSSTSAVLVPRHRGPHRRRVWRGCAQLGVPQHRQLGRRPRRRVARAVFAQRRTHHHDAIAASGGTRPSDRRMPRRRDVPTHRAACAGAWRTFENDVLVARRRCARGGLVGGEHHAEFASAGNWGRWSCRDDVMRRPGSPYEWRIPCPFPDRSTAREGPEGGMATIAVIATPAGRDLPGCASSRTVLGLTLGVDHQGSARAMTNGPAEGASTAATAVPTATVHVALLGRFEVTVDGVRSPRATGRAAMAAALVKVLAMTPDRRLHREQIIDRLWPDESIDEAAPKLHKAAHFARRAVRCRTRWCCATTTSCSAPTPTRSSTWCGSRKLARRALVDEDVAAAREALATYGGELLPRTATKRGPRSVGSNFVSATSTCSVSTVVGKPLSRSIAAMSFRPSGHHATARGEWRPPRGVASVRAHGPRPAT